jgi:hypothetical protein
LSHETAAANHAADIKPNICRKEGESMPTTTPANPFQFPLSGDLTQAINPWTWWLRMMSQIGFININMTESSDPGMERQIVENVAGYGKQLGRVVEVLDALFSHTATSEWSAEQKKALGDFLDLAGEIAAVKGDTIAPTTANIDRFLGGIRHLKETDEKRYGEVLERLRKELPA